MVRLTPTDTSGLPFRLADFETLVEGLDYAGGAETGCNFFSERGELRAVLTYREIREGAIDLALRLDAAGLERGCRMAIIAETRPEFLTFFFACQYAGIVPVPLPLSVNLGGREAYVARLRAMMQRADVSAAVCSADLIEMLQDAVSELNVGLVGTYDDFYALPARGGELRPLQRHEPCYIQYSSGSTSLPRGVLVSQKAITSNVRGIAVAGLRLGPDDRATSWLPLYHDMGLVGFCLTPALAQRSIDYIATTTFARRPLLWLKLISEYGGTVSFSPTFGYELCLRRASNLQDGQFDLSRWRIAGIGGEMVRASVLSAFAERFAPFGFDNSAFLPSYGLAESTLAVSFSHVGGGAHTDAVDREAAARTGFARPVSSRKSALLARTRTFVRCGHVLPGHRLEIRDGDGNALPERVIGRVCIKGPSLMQGYFRDPEATAAAITDDGWLDTGDMGYLVDGELVITGRSKDLIISNGRNIWPQDLEWAVEKIDGVRPGDVAAFAVNEEEAGEKVVVVVECRSSGFGARQELRREIAAAVHRAAGVTCEVVLTAPRSLTFTSSGKLSRAAVKSHYLDGTICDLDAEDHFSEQQPLAMAVGSR